MMIDWDAILDGDMKSIRNVALSFAFWVLAIAGGMILFWWMMMTPSYG